MDGGMLSLPCVVDSLLTILVFVSLVSGAYLFFSRKKNHLPEGIQLSEVAETESLEADIHFYKNLDPAGRLQFQADMLDFLHRVAIVGVGIDISRRDRLLVACSAVIPVFRFPQWQYYDLDEVLVYESPINLRFQTNQPDSVILGLVGTGQMERKMVLTRQALEEGFANKTDHYNVGIHEFIHIIDKEDGRIDGLPKVLMDKPYAIPWLQMIRAKIADMEKGKSDIDPYGATNLSEFLAVAGEYFFERPELLKTKHPALYHMMDHLFSGRLTS